jgi:hypothetical protein
VVIGMMVGFQPSAISCRQREVEMRLRTIGIGFVCFMATGAALAAPPRLEVGAPFPDVVLPDIDDGSPRSIRSFRGEKVVLHVFASW